MKVEIPTYIDIGAAMQRLLHNTPFQTESANASVEVQYVTQKRNGNVLMASTPGPSSLPHEVSMDDLRSGLVQHSPSIMMFIDPFTAIAWGWMQVEDAPLPAALHTFLSLTKGQQDAALKSVSSS